MEISRYIKHLFQHIGHTRFHLNRIDERLNSITSMVQKYHAQFRVAILQDKIVNCTTMGITSESICDHEVIVSLTTYGKRIYDVALTIESIMQGTIKPNRIILWLSEVEFKNSKLPHSLLLQEKRGLQIMYCEDLLSYKKLIPTLQNYPHACVVTIDDDVIYDSNFLSNILIAHHAQPHAICAGRIHRMKLDPNNKPLSYIHWQEIVTDYNESRLNFFTGVGGVFYPVGSLHQEVLNKDVFMDICCHGDDIWFYAMAVLNNTPIIKYFSHNSEGDFLEFDYIQEEALSIKNTNPNECRNDKQLYAVFEKYNLGQIITSQMY